MSRQVQCKFQALPRDGKRCRGEPTGGHAERDVPPVLGFGHIPAAYLTDNSCILVERIPGGIPVIQAQGGQML